MQAVNDRYGYEFGNRVLDDIEMKLKSQFASSEVTRLAGDEFAVIQQGSEFVDFVQTVREIVEQAKRELNIGLGYGVGVGPTETQARRAARTVLFRHKQRATNASR